MTGTAVRYISSRPCRDSTEPGTRVPVSPYVIRALDAADRGEGLAQGRPVITCATCGLRRREFAGGRCHRCHFVLALMAAYPAEERSIARSETVMYRYRRSAQVGSKAPRGPKGW